MVPVKRVGRQSQAAARAPDTIWLRLALPHRHAPRVGALIAEVLVPGRRADVLLHQIEGELHPARVSDTFVMTTVGVSCILLKAGGEIFVYK